MKLKNDEVNEFLKERREGADLFKKYLANPRANTNATKIEVNPLKYPYNEFS
jgi:hypothetical protein